MFEYHEMLLIIFQLVLLWGSKVSAIVTVSAARDRKALQHGYNLS